MDCSIGKGGKVKGVRIGTKNSDSEINNTEKKHQVQEQQKVYSVW
jgi:hypothetical protein